MGEQSIQSDDMTLKRVYQDFYRVPDYQREYVWGETWIMHTISASGAGPS
jgi:uncharacterized protein with ParB-like and HNH nuclease domain